jgi:hypothetical protein
MATCSEWQMGNKSCLQLSVKHEGIILVSSTFKLIVSYTWQYSLRKRWWCFCTSDRCLNFQGGCFLFMFYWRCCWWPGDLLEWFMLQLVWLTAGHVKIFFSHFHTELHTGTYLPPLPFGYIFEFCICVLWFSGLWYRCHTGCITHIIIFFEPYWYSITCFA